MASNIPAQGAVTAYACGFELGTLDLVFELGLGDAGVAGPGEA